MADNRPGHSCEGASEETPYPYEPLQDDEFRVLRIKKSHAHGTFECDLITVSTTDHPVYTALSYVWGTERDPVPVMLDSYPVFVTSNLKDALEELSELGSGRFFWWIDALCIDQFDHTERGHQVEKMSWIYANATEVLIHLRTESRLEILDIVFNGNYSTSYDALRTLSAGCTQVEFTHLRKHLPALLQGSTVDKCFAFEYSTLATNSYWSRVWVAQEVAYARKVSILVNGGHTFDYNDIVDHRSLLKLNKVFGVDLREWGRLEVREKHLKGMAAPNPSRGTKLWLSTIRGKQCQDPRDYIYALLYLFPPRLLEDLTIDYTVPVQDLYWSFTKAYIQETKDLSVISWGKSKVTNTVPSWSGDFCQSALDPFTAYDLHLGPVNSRPPEFQFSDDGKDLEVLARSIGEVMYTVALNSRSNPRNLFESLELHKDWAETPSACMRFGRTLWLGQRDPPTASRDILNDLLASSYALGPLKDSRVLFKCCATFVTEMDGNCPIEVDFGIGPQDMQAGDEVYMIFGCAPMVVLRPVGEKFRVVGDAFMDCPGLIYDLYGASSQMITLI